MPDAALVGARLADRPFHGEGARQESARLRHGMAQVRVALEAQKSLVGVALMVWVQPLNSTFEPYRTQL
jgi:hypothetical protein